MALSILLTAIAIIVLLVGSYTDLKTREVPDWVNFSLIFAALGIRLIFSVSLGFKVLVSGILGFALCFLLAYAFYYLGQWGGGDSKLLMGIGAVIGIPYQFTNESLTLPIFLLMLLLIGALFGIVWMIVLAIQKRAMFVRAWKKLYKKHRKTHILSFVVTVLIGLLVYNDPLFLPFLFFPLPLFHVFLFIHAAEKSCFRVVVPISKITEGEWLDEDIVVHGKKILEKKTVDKEDLKILKKYPDYKVRIKQGIPFVPSFLVAYLITVFGRGVVDILYLGLFG